jgi:type III pantothenate kinase
VAADWLIDLGHSRIKWARATDNGQLEATGSCPVDQPGPLETLLLDAVGARLWASGQSRPEAVEWLATLAGQRGLRLATLTTGQVELAVAPAYPGLGCDRWLALQWPWQQSRSALCVVDCGTAVTVDVVDARGRHRGGWIMAGLDVARNALLERAPGLPRKIEAAGNAMHPACDSASAIASGVLLQVAGAIERAVAVAATELDTDPVVWITGGDSAAVSPLIRLETTRDDHLVLRGLAMASRTC